MHASAATKAVRTMTMMIMMMMMMLCMFDYDDDAGFSRICVCFEDSDSGCEVFATGSFAAKAMRGAT
jgi:hypothetical protein